MTHNSEVIKRLMRRIGLRRRIEQHRRPGA